VYLPFFQHRAQHRVQKPGANGEVALMAIFAIDDSLPLDLGFCGVELD
jgi:hypothetical protein